METNPIPETQYFLPLSKHRIMDQASKATDLECDIQLPEFYGKVSMMIT
jgi:hypothetical protein